MLSNQRSYLTKFPLVAVPLPIKPLKPIDLHIYYTFFITWEGKCSLICLKHKKKTIDFLFKLKKEPSNVIYGNIEMDCIK